MDRKAGWPKRRTAILVLHGVGSQYPLETLDMFSRTLIRELRGRTGEKTSLEHMVALRKDPDGAEWRDNYIRIRPGGEGGPIDVYEYYWANLSENILDLENLRRWVAQVVRGARRFYEENEELGRKYGDRSIFFSRDGKLRKGVYHASILAAFGLIPAKTATSAWIASAAGRVPLFGWVLRRLAGVFDREATSYLTNVVGDVAVYNSLDPKSSYFEVRKKILAGAVAAVKHRLETGRPEPF